MSWVKLDDRFPGHRKVEDLSDGAFRLHVTALCRCASKESDGKLTKKAALKIGSQRHIDELVKAWLWAEDGEGGYEINDYLEYNPSHEQLEKKRQATRERLKRLRNASSDERTPPETDPPSTPRGNAPRNAVTAGVTEPPGNAGGNAAGNTTPLPLPLPLGSTSQDQEDTKESDPDPAQPDRSSRAGGGRATKRPFPSDFPPAESFFEWAATQNFPAWWVADRHAGYGDKAIAKGWKYADWRRAFQDYLRGEVGYGRGPDKLAHLAPAGGAAGSEADAAERRARRREAEARVLGKAAP